MTRAPAWASSGETYFRYTGCQLLAVASQRRRNKKVLWAAFDKEQSPSQELQLLSESLEPNTIQLWDRISK